MTPHKILNLIAEGYFAEAIDDRYVLIHNPKYQDGTIDGESEDPYITWDTWEDNDD